jgi:outer membrane protein OmpA-like peptidoglycan-associated protein
MTFRVGLGVWMTALLLPAAAKAQVVAEARDFPIERFRWTFARTGVLDAEWGGIPRPGSWDLGLWLGTANDPLVLYREDAAGEQTELSSLVAQRTSATLMLSYSPWRWLEMGLEAPLILAQSRDGSIPGVASMLASISGAGLGDLRLAPKFGLLRSASHGVDLAILPAVTVPTAGRSDYRGENGVSFSPELIVSRSVRRTRIAANLGYRVRPNASLLNLAVEDELFATVAAGRAVATTIEIDLGASLATAAKSPVSSDNQDHLEALAGISWDAPGPLLLTLIGGLGLNEGFGTPDWRGVLAVRFGSVERDDGDQDRDGLRDLADRCPDAPEDHDQFQDLDGCPDLDNDGDTVLDVVDRAPLLPEDRDGFQDEDGAPDPDNDGDRISDGDDHCPLQAESVNGYQDQDGCPDQADRDDDGISDERDTCVDQPEDRDNFQDLDGCPDPDNDSDSVLDVVDACPAQAGPRENRGCPDGDRDGDTVVDRLDNCPDEKGSTANRGCANKQLVVLSAGKLEILEVVYFQVNRDRILPRSFPLLDNVAAVITAHPEISGIEVEGHTDSQGDDRYNKTLSQRRAGAVVTYLEGRGVAAGRLTATGYGEERPLADNASKVGRAKNRRVEFKLTGGENIESNVSPPPAATIEK